MENRGVVAGASGPLAGLMASQIPTVITTSATIPAASSMNIERCLGAACLMALLRRRRPRLRRLPDFERIDPDRLGDVLKLGRAKIADREFEPTLDLTIGVLRQAYRARLADAFQPRGDVDAIAHEIPVALLDNVAQMDADPEFYAALFGATRRCARPSPFCISMAQRTASTTLRNSMRLPSPVRLTMRP